MNVVVDTNMVFSALISPDGSVSDILLNSNDFFEFFAPSFIEEELDKYEKKLLKYSGLTLRQLNESKRLYLKKIRLISPEFIEEETWQEAFSLTKDVDEKDTPFVALALKLDAPLWTGDGKLSLGLEEKGADWIVNTAFLRKVRNQ